MYGIWISSGTTQSPSPLNTNNVAIGDICFHRTQQIYSWEGKRDRLHADVLFPVLCMIEETSTLLGQSYGRDECMLPNLTLKNHYNIGN